jgi:hypothetical protein
MSAPLGPRGWSIGRATIGSTLRDVGALVPPNLNTGGAAIGVLNGGLDTGEEDWVEFMDLPVEFLNLEGGVGGADTSLFPWEDYGRAEERSGEGGSGVSLDSNGFMVVEVEIEEEEDRRLSSPRRLRQQQQQQQQQGQDGVGVEESQIDTDADMIMYAPADIQNNGLGITGTQTGDELGTTAPTTIPIPELSSDVSYSSSTSLPTISNPTFTTKPVSPVRKRKQTKKIRLSLQHPALSFAAYNPNLKILRMDAYPLHLTLLSKLAPNLTKLHIREPLQCIGSLQGLRKLTSLSLGTGNWDFVDSSLAGWGGSVGSKSVAMLKGMKGSPAFTWETSAMSGRCTYRILSGMDKETRRGLEALGIGGVHLESFLEFLVGGLDELLKNEGEYLEQESGKESRKKGTGKGKEKRLMAKASIETGITTDDDLVGVADMEISSSPGSIARGEPMAMDSALSEPAAVADNESQLASQPEPEPDYESDFEENVIMEEASDDDNDDDILSGLGLSIPRSPSGSNLAAIARSSHTHSIFGLAANHLSKSKKSPSAEFLSASSSIINPHSLPSPDQCDKLFHNPSVAPFPSLKRLWVRAIPRFNVKQLYQLLLCCPGLTDLDVSFEGRLVSLDLFVGFVLLLVDRYNETKHAPIRSSVGTDIEITTSQDDKSIPLEETTTMMGIDKIADGKEETVYKTKGYMLADCLRLHLWIGQRDYDDAQRNGLLKGLETFAKDSGGGRVMVKFLSDPD